jgi:hypothetical protein
MGDKWEVWIFQREPVSDVARYRYVQVYGGADEAEAVRVAHAQAAAGVGCIRIVWRP